MIHIFAKNIPSVVGHYATKSSAPGTVHDCTKTRLHWEFQIETHAFTLRLLLSYDTTPQHVTTQHLPHHTISRRCGVGVKDPNFVPPTPPAPPPTHSHLSTLVSPLFSLVYYICLSLLPPLSISPFSLFSSERLSNQKKI